MRTCDGLLFATYMCDRKNGWSGWRADREGLKKSKM